MKKTKQPSFQIIAQSGQARAGVIQTAHGPVETPAFVPCATHGSLRGVDLRALEGSPKISPNPSLRLRLPFGAKRGTPPPFAKGDRGGFSSGDADLQLILANIYHLMLRPGIETIEAMGGLHKFMAWDRAIITDSGGFQAFSLGGKTSARSPKGEGGLTLARYEPDGIRFRSHLDGSEQFLTPERVIDMQQRIGVDIGTCLDVCTGFPVPEAEVAVAVDQTNDWAERSIRARWEHLGGVRQDSSEVKEAGRGMLLYGMVQGSIYPKQRQRSAEFLRDLPFDGFAIGGNMYTFGETIKELAAEKPMMWETVSYTTSLLPADKPRHLLGVGEPSDLEAGVRAGIDTFDCVMASRIARHGSGWVRRDAGEWAYDRVNFMAAQWKQSGLPIDEHCACPSCTSGYTRAYLHHLFKINDPLSGALLTIHNLHFLRELIADIRQRIINGTFA